MSRLLTSRRALLGGLLAGVAGPALASPASWRQLLRRTATAAPEYAALTGAEPFSIDLGPRNGDSTFSPSRYIQGPSLTNLWGNGNNAGSSGGRLASALAIRLRFQEGGRPTTSNDDQIQQAMPIFGTGAQSDTRATSLWYYPRQHASAGFAGRFVLHGRSGTGVYLGDRDPTTGAGGSASANRGLRTVTPTYDYTGVTNLVVGGRGGATGNFEAFSVQDDVFSLGDAFDPGGTFLGNATPTNAVRFGTVVGASANLGGFYSGALGDFVQLEGTAGTDAEWRRFEQGEDPFAIWGASVAAYYPFKGIADLAQGSGSRSYAACTLAGTTSYLKTGTQLRPTRVSTNGLLARPHWRGFTHAVDSASLMAIHALPVASRPAALAALTGDAVRDVKIIGAATHLEARAIRISDDQVVKGWTRCTATAATGWVETILPGVLARKCRFEYRREDDPTCIARVNDFEGVGIVAAFPAQSQVDISLFDATANTLTPNADSLVSYTAMRGRGVRWVPTDGGTLRVQKQMSDAVVAAALMWDAFDNKGVPLEIVGMTVAGTGLTELIYHSNANGLDMFGDGAAVTSGQVTAVMKAKKARISAYPFSWCTNDESTRSGGAYVTFSTIYGNRTPTELAWTSRMNEFFAGIPKAGAGAPELAERSNLSQFSPPFRPLVVMFPRSKRRDATNATAGGATAYEDFRVIQHDFAESGTGKNAAVDAVLGGFQIDHGYTSASDDEHPARADPMGLITFLTRMIQGLAQVVGATTLANPRSRVASATGAGTANIDISFTLENGGTLDTLVPAAGVALTQFEIQENGGSWLKTGFTASIVSGKARLTRSSGTWHATTKVRFLNGFPMAVGNASLATENTNLRGLLIERVSGLQPAPVLALTSTTILGGAAMQSYVPIRPSLAEITAS